MKNFELLLESLRLFFKDCNFKRKGYFFIKETKEFFQIINFQKSKKSTQQRIIFFINIGIVSKEILKYKRLEFNNNLMHNQWEKRVENLITSDSTQNFQISELDDIQDILVPLKKLFKEVVIPQLEKYADEKGLIDYLIEVLIKHPLFSYNDVESLLILIKVYNPEKISLIIPIINSKVKDSNDRQFLNELFKELS